MTFTIIKHTPSSRESLPGTKLGCCCKIQPPVAQGVNLDPCLTVQRLKENCIFYHLEHTMLIIISCLIAVKNLSWRRKKFSLVVSAASICFGGKCPIKRWMINTWKDSDSLCWKPSSPPSVVHHCLKLGEANLDKLSFWKINSKFSTKTEKIENWKRLEKSNPAIAVEVGFPYHFLNLVSVKKTLRKKLKKKCKKLRKKSRGRLPVSFPQPRLC